MAKSCRIFQRGLCDGPNNIRWRHIPHANDPRRNRGFASRRQTPIPSRKRISGAIRKQRGPLSASLRSPSLFLPEGVVRHCGWWHGQVWISGVWELRTLPHPYRRGFLIQTGLDASHLCLMVESGIKVAHAHLGVSSISGPCLSNFTTVYSGAPWFFSAAAAVRQSSGAL